jgi:hypothetical protein
MSKGGEIIVENNIRKIISSIIGSSDDFTLLESKDVVDIIICRNARPQKLFFIEVKHYAGSNGRINFGNDKGKGFQPEILEKELDYFEKNLIWVFQNESDSNYYILTNKDCRKYYSGGFKGIKQNNFQRKLFDEIPPKNKTEFKKWIGDWLKK